MKRNWLVKVKYKQPFTMIVMDGDETAEHVCRCIFGERLEWVR